MNADHVIPGFLTETKLPGGPDLLLHNFPEHAASGSDCERFLGFRLNEEPFAVGAGDVLEIVRSLESTPLPGGPAWLSGIASLRGDIIPVVDFMKLLGRPESDVSSRSKLIVLRPVEGFTPVAFAVDCLKDVAVFFTGDIHLAPIPPAPFLKKCVFSEAETVHLLDTEEFYAVLSERD